MGKWTARRMLIIGSTYPNYSAKHTESACIGAILEDDLKLVRLHPIPRRYLDSDERFHAFQRIEAEILKHEEDPRPESYRIAHDTIQRGDVIPSENSEERRQYLENSPYLFRSLEHFQEKQQENSISMGIIKPQSITRCEISLRSSAERSDWEKTERCLRSQQAQYDENPMPLGFPEADFPVSWICCNGCAGHTMNLEQWGIQELYRNHSDKAEAKQKALNSMRERLDLDKYDVFFFLGSLGDPQNSIGLMDTCHIAKKHPFI